MQDNGNNKIMTLSFVICGVLMFMTVQVLLTNFAASFALVARLHSNEVFRHGLPIGVALLTFALLQFNAKVRVWADECISEIRKVVWPSRKDTVGMTTVVCVMVLIVGLMLGAFDFLSQHLVRWFVNINFWH